MLWRWQYWYPPPVGSRRRSVDSDCPRGSPLAVVASGMVVVVHVVGVVLEWSSDGGGLAANRFPRVVVAVVVVHSERRLVLAPPSEVYSVTMMTRVPSGKKIIMLTWMTLLIRNGEMRLPGTTRCSVG